MRWKQELIGDNDDDE